MRREEQPPGWSKNGQEAGRTREGKGTGAGLGKGGHIAAAAHSAPAVANRHCLVPRECAMQCKGIASNETKNVREEGRVEKSHTHTHATKKRQLGRSREGRENRPRAFGG